MSDIVQNNSLFDDVKNLIEDVKSSVAIQVNSALTLLYWNIGKKINDNILENKRADYGKEIVHLLSAQLVQEFGRGYAKRNLLNMVRFAKIYDDENIVHSLSAQLRWTHIKALIYIEDALKRDLKIKTI